MLSPRDWVYTVHVLYNLWRMWPQLNDAAAPLFPLSPQLETWASPGPHTPVVQDHAWGRATFARCDRALPVILFSSGAAADGTGYEPLVRHWASHGFCVLQPVHADSYTRHLAAIGQPLRAWRRVVWDVWGLVLGDAHPWRMRVKDLTALMDRLPQLTLELEQPLHTDGIGVGGYSYGARAALLSGGAAHQGRRHVHRYRDTRVRAVLAISPENGVHGGPPWTWTELAVPFLVLTGDRDQDVLGRGHGPKADPVRYARAGLGQLVVLPGASHFAFSGRLLEAAKTPQERAAQEAIFGAVKAQTLLFWKSHLEMLPSGQERQERAE